jgi:hypothetical protein
MGGVEFRMRPARQIQQLATARQRRSKRTDQQRATTPGAAFGDSGGRGVQNELNSEGRLHRAQRSATLAAVLRAVRAVTRIEHRMLCLSSATRRYCRMTA